MKVKVAQLCLSLCDPMDYTVHEILQARILERVAFPSSTNPGIKPGSSTLQTDSFSAEATREAQGYWSRYPIPSPGHLPDPGIKLGSPALQADSLPTEL